MIGYKTRLGECLCENSLDTIARLPDNSINLIMTSPPFSLQRKKKYNNFTSSKR